MIRPTVPALRWRDFVQAAARHAASRLGAASGGADALRQALAQASRLPLAHWHVMGSGRAALHAVVQATRRAAGDEALLPGYTCVVVPHVFAHLGVPLRYVDLPPEGVNPRAQDWAAAIGPRTRWVVVPHNFGVASPGLPALRERFPEVVFIEDAAHALGAAGEGGWLGQGGHAAFFSFEYAKCLSTGLGGALLVNDPLLRQALSAQALTDAPRGGRETARILATLAYHLSQATWPSAVAGGFDRLLRASSALRGMAASTPEAELAGAQAPDYRAGLPDALAALALPQLRRLPALNALRRRQAADHDLLLQGSPWVRPLAPAGTTLLRYPVALADPTWRPAWEQGLRRLGIEPGRWFDHVVHPAGSAGHGYVAGSCPHGERLAASIGNLPLGLHATLSARQRDGLRQLAATPPAHGSVRAAAA